MLKRLSVVPLSILAACSAPSGPGNEAVANDAAVQELSVEAASPANSPDDVPVSDRPPPAPLTSGTPIAGEWDPDIMTVTLQGDGFLIEDAKHSWPVQFETSSIDFVRNGLASFGTPVLSHGPADCPAGKLDFLTYANGLEVAFQDEKLAGYWVKEGARGIATAGGVRPGSPRSALKAEGHETSFGTTYDLDGVIAMLDDKGTRVTDLYAGAACIYD